MKKSALLLCAACFLVPSLEGCDPAYRYVFYPDERQEYTLVPDLEHFLLSGDSSYAIGKDSLSIAFDRRTYKIEVKFLSDYQLNTSEFPNDSKEGEFSANPFTYANWVDPELGYTPKRFSVFKVSIYNYTSSKLNFDPERSSLVSDRGDVLPGYGREEKSSKNQSLESYFKKRKGSSGVDDEVYERRMGIMRTNVLYLGKPIFQGDSREGLVVFDPLDESVEKVKLIMQDFIVGYDENNEPAEFSTLQFYFRRVPMKIQPPVLHAGGNDSTLASSRNPLGLKQTTFDLVQLRYRIELSEEGAGEQWNVKPNALPSLLRFVKDSLGLQPNLRVATMDATEISEVPLVVLLAGSSRPVLGENEITNLSNLARQGGLLLVDNAVFPTSYQYSSFVGQVLESIGSKLGRLARVQPIPKDHEIYRSWKRLPDLPEGMDNFESMPNPKQSLEGLFLGERLVAIGSTKGYSMVWDRDDPRNTSQLTLGANIVAYALRAKSLTP